MLSQENIYQHLHKKEYDSIISILHQHKEWLKEDPSMSYAINTFLREYFQEIRHVPLTESSKYNLWKLFTIHTQKFFELPAEYAVQLIGLIWDNEVNETWYRAAKPYPEDAICAKIIREFENLQQRKSAEVDLVIDPYLSAISRPKVHFETKIVDNGSFDPYLKVYVRDQDDLKPLADLLALLPAVKNANVTRKRKNKDDLTVYPQPPYLIQETQEQVELAMDAYFNKRPFDPVFKEEVISAISDKAYFEVLDYIISAGESLEKTSRDTASWEEPAFRNYLVGFLNALSKKHTVTGETFNKQGKSDILVQDEHKRNLLVTECKLWAGKAKLLEAIDQLIELYITWRDEKAAILIFNKSVAKFTDLIEKAVATVQSHPLCYLYKGKRHDTSFSFIFRNPDDPAKLIQLELILFNFYSAAF
jgi:hypothetical protein